MIVEVLPQPLLLTAVAPPELLPLDPEPELLLAPESPDEEDDELLLELELPLLPELPLDAPPPLDPLDPELLLAPELAEPGAPPEVLPVPEPDVLPWLPELVALPLAAADPVLLPELGSVLGELLAPLLHATATTASHAGICANPRRRGPRPVGRYGRFMDAGASHVSCRSARNGSPGRNLVIPR